MDENIKHEAFYLKADEETDALFKKAFDKICSIGFEQRELLRTISFVGTKAKMQKTDKKILFNEIKPYLLKYYSNHTTLAPVMEWLEKSAPEMVKEYNHNHEVLSKAFKNNIILANKKAGNNIVIDEVTKKYADKADEIIHEVDEINVKYYNPHDESMEAND